MRSADVVVAIAAVVPAVAVAIAAWRLRAALAALLAVAGLAGALASVGLRIAGALQDVTAPLLASTVVVGMAAGLLAIGHVFNRLLGPGTE